MTVEHDSRVVELRTRVVGALRLQLERLRAAHPSVTFEVFDWDVRGDGGRRNDAVLGLDANLPASSAAASHCVSLLVIVAGVDSHPELEFLGVSWSAPDPSDESVVIRESLPFTEQIAGRVIDAIPSLAEALSAALLRAGY